MQATAIASVMANEPAGTSRTEGLFGKGVAPLEERYQLRHTRFRAASGFPLVCANTGGGRAAVCGDRLSQIKGCRTISSGKSSNHAVSWRGPLWPPGCDPLHQAKGSGTSHNHGVPSPTAASVHGFPRGVRSGHPGVEWLGTAVWSAMCIHRKEAYRPGTDRAQVEQSKDAKNSVKRVKSPWSRRGNGGEWCCCFAVPHTDDWLIDGGILITHHWYVCDKRQPSKRPWASPGISHWAPSPSAVVSNDAAVVCVGTQSWWSSRWQTACQGPRHLHVRYVVCLCKEGEGLGDGWAIALLHPDMMWHHVRDPAVLLCYY